MPLDDIVIDRVPAAVSNHGSLSTSLQITDYASLKARDGQGALQCRRQETTRRRPGVFGARGGIGVQR